MLLFYPAWKFLQRTVFSLKWWREHWYLPWLFIAGFVGWLLSGGRGSVLSLVKKTTEIRSEERDNIIDIRRKHIEREAQIEREVQRRKAEIKAQGVKDLEELKSRIKKERQMLSGNSEAINKDLNDALDD
tara:strand:- start:309 stop:698 length:390 start_codon:yes stop_codon:yes gene_type:complete